MYRRPGLSVRIDLRVPPDLRAAFGMAAKARGVTVSHALRDCMEAFISATVADAPQNAQGPTREEPGLGGDSLHDLAHTTTAGSVAHGKA
jgi:hypothetical protein